MYDRDSFLAAGDIHQIVAHWQTSQLTLLREHGFRRVDLAAWAASHVAGCSSVLSRTRGLRGFAEAAGTRFETNGARRGKREQVRDLVRDVHLFQMAPTLFSPKEICKTYSGEPCVLFYRSLLLLRFSKRPRRCVRNSVGTDATWIKQSLDPANTASVRPGPVDLDQHCTKQKEILWFYNWYSHFPPPEEKSFFFHWRRGCNMR